MATLNNGIFTPQIAMSPRVFRGLMNHQGFTGNRSDEVEAFRIHIEEYFRVHERMPSLLEVGSGLGDMAEHFADIVGEEKYQGIDSNRNFVREAKKRFPHLFFTLQNFFLLEESALYDMVCVPYTLLNLFPFEIQALFILKARNHGKVVIIDTVLPDVHGVHDDVTRTLGKEEFGGDTETVAYFMCERRLREICTQDASTSFTCHHYNKKLTEE